MQFDEVFSFKEILKYLENCSRETLAVFDIDNTLMKPKQQLGSVTWFDHVLSDYEKRGISFDAAEKIVTDRWLQVQPYMQVEPVDPNTPTVIQEIQKRAIPVITLTARQSIESEWTHKQIKTIGLDFSKNHYESLQEFSLNYRAIYDRGILFATPFNKKSHVLHAFLKKNNLSPKKILFVDDLLSNLIDIKDSFLATSTECIALRFSGADEYVKNFNPHVAEIQWKEFPRFISDEEALKMMENL